ncbi:hypothetical protein HN451_09620 [archaeon]|nr:hypothetical protein [archaeon]
MKKIMFILMVFLISLTSALADTYVEVEVDGDEIDFEDGIRLALEKGRDIEVKVKLRADEEMEAVQVKAMITGYEHGIISDISETFDLKANSTYRKYLDLEIPYDLEVFEDNEGDYKLRILVMDRDGSTGRYDYDLTFDADRHSVAIKDILLNPSKEVVAGRGLIVSARLKNYGQKEEDSIRVKISIPDLGIEDSDYVDSLEIDESLTTEDLFLRLPTCTKPGTYEVLVRLDFNDDYDDVERETEIEVLDNPSCTGSYQGNGNSNTGGVVGNVQSTLALPRIVDVIKGTTGQVYPIQITNNGPTKKSYSLKLSGYEKFGTAFIDGGSLIMIEPRQMGTLYLYLIADKDAEPGEKIFVIDVSTRDELQSVVLTANVIGELPKEEDSKGLLGNVENLTGTLEMGLIGLVVLLIVTGVFAGIAKISRQ